MWEWASGWAGACGYHEDSVYCRGLKIEFPPYDPVQTIYLLVTPPHLQSKREDVKVENLFGQSHLQSVSLSQVRLFMEAWSSTPPISLLPFQ